MTATSNVGPLENRDSPLPPAECEAVLRRACFGHLAGDCAGYVSDAIRGHSFRCDPRRHRLVYRDYIADRQADGQYPHARHVVCLLPAHELLGCEQTSRVLIVTPPLSNVRGL